MNSLAPEDIVNLVSKQAGIYKHKTRSATDGNIFIPQLNLSKAQEAISYIDAKLWNEILKDKKKTQSLEIPPDMHKNTVT